MKKLSLAVMLAFAVESSAFAGDSPVYGGLSIGPSTIASFSTTAVGVFAGYKFNNVRMSGMESFALEGQYTSLGSDGYGDNFSSIGIDAVASFPITSARDLSIFGKLGINSISGNFSCGRFCSYSSSSGLVGDFGLGVQYKLSREFSVRAGYQYYDTNFDAVYVAGIYNF